MVGAYALMMLALCLLVKGNRSVIDLTLIPLGRMARVLTRQFVTPKPPPDSRRSFAFRPL